jgi:hypothetical protein
MPIIMARPTIQPEKRLTVAPIYVAQGSLSQFKALPEEVRRTIRTTLREVAESTINFNYLKYLDTLGTNNSFSIEKTLDAE